MQKQSSHLFYDPDALNSISILDVCDHLGLNVEKRGKNYWCKVRPERTASVILHPESNRFYDFGNQQKGGTIALVMYATGCNGRDAVKFLADSFGLKPVKSRQEIIARPLSNWEYERIGLQGDLATKNMVFPVETATLDELAELSQMYQMSMNELRRTHPSVYASILTEKAIPYVDQLREQYYRDVWNYYDLLRTFGQGVTFFDSQRTQAKFESQTADLERAERILQKAAYQTKIDVPEPRHYDPMRVFSRIKQGRISIPLGPVPQSSMEE